MGISSELKTEIEEIFAERWQETKGQVVPNPEDLLLGNEARYFERATVLYADISGSTALVDNLSWAKAGEIYKSYLTCAARIIREQDGRITSYDGDRIMAVFIGDYQTSHAAKCGLMINWAVRNIVNPAFKAQYPQTTYEIKQVVGIDTSPVHAARIGIRGGNDLVWIGRAANYAAKLTTCRNDFQTWITEDAFNKLSPETKFGGNQKENMWKRHTWTGMNDKPVYGSSWWWSF